MKYIPVILRYALGIPLVAFGILGLFSVMPDPRAAWEGAEGFTPQASNFIIFMWESGFLGPLVALTHLVTGLLLVINRYVPLALVLHLPVSFMMTAFHLVLDPGTGIMAFAILLINLFLIYKYRKYFSGLLESKTTVA